MRWSSSSEHRYNKTIPYKKNSLEEFCKKKNYEYIWLDFSYDKRFLNIYIRECS